MKPPGRLFVNVVRSSADARVGLLGCAALLVSACVGNPFEDAQVDPRSPIAAEVTRVARANTDFPSFSEIPATPSDVRPMRMFRDAVRETEQVRAQIERETAPSTWTLQNTEGFAAAARRDAGPDIPPADPRDTEAYAAELRRRATPPPPPKR